MDPLVELAKLATALVGLAAAVIKLLSEAGESKHDDKE